MYFFAYFWSMYVVNQVYNMHYMFNFIFTYPRTLVYWFWDFSIFDKLGQIDWNVELILSYYIVSKCVNVFLLSYLSTLVYCWIWACGYIQTLCFWTTYFFFLDVFMYSKCTVFCHVNITYMCTLWLSNISGIFIYLKLIDFFFGVLAMPVTFNALC